MRGFDIIGYGNQSKGKGEQDLTTRYEFETLGGDELPESDMVNATWKVVETMVDMDEGDIVFTLRVEPLIDFISISRANDQYYASSRRSFNRRVRVMAYPSTSCSAPFALPRSYLR
jgi:hypothetical protein